MVLPRGPMCAIVVFPGHSHLLFANLIFFIYQRNLCLGVFEASFEKLTIDLTHIEHA